MPFNLLTFIREFDTLCVVLWQTSVSQLSQYNLHFTMEVKSEREPPSVKFAPGSSKADKRVVLYNETYSIELRWFMQFFSKPYVLRNDL